MCEYREVLTREPAQTAAYEERRKLEEEAARLLAGRRPFHWWLEFPEVFAADATPVPAEQEFDPATAPPFEPGFAAFLSNPPFMGSQMITGAMGEEYREYLVEVLANGRRGKADLCAYFFLRAGDLLRVGGGLGLLATNSIAQGETREVGLDQIKGVIYRAIPSRP